MRKPSLPQSSVATNSQKVKMSDQENQSSANDQEQPSPGAVRKSTQSRLLKAVSDATGVQIDNVDALVEIVSRASKPEVQQAQEAVPTDLAKQLQAMQAELANHKAAIAQKELENQLTRAMGAQFDDEVQDYAMTKIKSQVKLVDGAWVAVNATGEVRYGVDGKVVTPAALVSEFAQNNGRLLKNAAPQGTGFQGAAKDASTNVVPDPTDLVAFKAWAEKQGLRGTNKLNIGVSLSNSMKR